jgi:hypothetical protein
VAVVWKLEAGRLRAGDQDEGTRDWKKRMNG